MVFGNYAKYYDLLYKDKDYKSEIDYIDKLIKKYGEIKVSSILDIGCGTGKHGNLLCDKGYTLKGIDLSEDMIREANKQKHSNASYTVANASKFELRQQFHTVLSLFHVVSYQNDNEDIEGMFSCVSEHLCQGGLFIFDFWYGPCVLTEKPVLRIKRLEDENIKVTRIAEPEVHYEKNVVDVNYELLIQDKATTDLEVINETHCMRYYFQPELNIILENSNLKALKYEEWVTGNQPSTNTWGVCCIAQKI